MNEIAWPSDRGYLLEASTIIREPGMVSHRVVLYHAPKTIHNGTYVVHYQSTDDPGAMWHGGYFDDPATGWEEFMRRVLKRKVARS